MHPRRRFLGLATLLPLGVELAACSAAPPRRLDDPGPPVAVSRPADGVSLRQLGFSNGPVDAVFLPSSIVVTRRVDQVNVTTAFGLAADGSAVLAFLRRTLSNQIWTIDADHAEALLFHNQGYDGAYTVSPDLWALTLRRRPV